jgi:hypothetical protein
MLYLTLDTSGEKGETHGFRLLLGVFFEPFLMRKIRAALYLQQTKVSVVHARLPDSKSLGNYIGIKLRKTLFHVRIAASKSAGFPTRPVDVPT